MGQPSVNPAGPQPSVITFDGVSTLQVTWDKEIAVDGDAGPSDLTLRWSGTRWDLGDGVWTQLDDFSGSIQLTDSAVPASPNETCDFTNGANSIVSASSGLPVASWTEFPVVAA